ncbi:hypothetical protein DMN91_005323 [Ooceraea biroi]|uniref:Uncharacterized protein n=1 Tax=Ooceraea biroi TaxID=2015173 RepID=A0A026VVB9_OOCBI|nr:hypothetical protein X777_15608 [Ooceraea biroi]RLU23045.1 hypothetical protein DMN91_005323 [Ooceraea biroi]
MINILLREWDLTIEKINAVVVSSSRTALIKALTNRSLTIVPCLLRTLQVCAQACFDNPDVAHILSKCRSVIGTIISHPGTYAALSMQEQSSALKEDAMLLDYPGVWTSTHNMLEQIVLHRSIITTILENGRNRSRTGRDYQRPVESYRGDARFLSPIWRISSSRRIS